MPPARKITPLLASLLMIALASPALAQGMPGGMDGGMGGGGMGGGDMSGGDMGGGPPGGGAGRPPQPPKPIKRARFDKIVTDMFRAADTNHDGTVTLDELHTLVEARRATIIKDRFTAIDTDRNGSISMAEFAAWQGKMGSAASSEDAATGDRTGPIAETVMPDAGDDRRLAALIEPLSGTVIARANTNYDAGVSLEELLAYEGKLFDAADTDHDGYLSMEELRPRDKDGQRMRGPRGMTGGAMGGPPPCPPGQSC